ncbi:MAG: trehalose-phosphatase [Chloroflexota bacterium]|nr:trehalose-phosphatase [Chloroflexota bacterium]
MPHLLNVWPRVSQLISGASHVLLLSDYDGTLAPIAQRPELAALPECSRELLTSLKESDRITAGVVSGRGLADLKEMVAIPGLVYAGNHGMEMEGPGWQFVHSQAGKLAPLLAKLGDVLKEGLGNLEGALVEGKGLTLSVHYRLTPQSLREEFFRSLDYALEEFGRGDDLRVTRGKEVVEVRPKVDWDKGKAILRVAASAPPGSLAIYFGDDLTDEDGFAAVHELNGISVFVGPPRQPTRALYRVDDPREVATALELIARL